MSLLGEIVVVISAEAMPLADLDRPAESRGGRDRHAALVGWRGRTLMGLRRLPGPRRCASQFAHPDLGTFIGHEDPRVGGHPCVNFGR